MEEEIRLGNRDKGWNDPPSMTFVKGPQTQNSPRRNLLNQRVAMPQNYFSPAHVAKSEQPLLGGGPPPTGFNPAHHAPNPAPPLGPALPPPPQGTPPLLPCGGSTAESPPLGHAAAGNASSGGVGGGGDCRAHSPGQPASCEATLAMLRGVLDQCRSCLQKRVLADIEKRLQVLESSWESDKLSDTVQQRTAQLASYLNDRQYSDAHEVHISLMVDHVSEVSKWMVGVKRLIHEATQALPPSKDEDDEESGTSQCPGPTASDREQPSIESAGRVDSGSATGNSTENSDPCVSECKEEQRTELGKEERGTSSEDRVHSTEEGESIANDVDKLDISHT